VWTGFTLGDSALASISATKVTAGTIDASVITVSNLDAGNITVGTLNGIAINTGTGATSFHVDATGRLFLGGATFANATFKVESNGAFSATSGTIAGTIAVSASGTLTTGSGLGGTTFGYDAAWSGTRSGVFSNGYGTGFASFTYGDISIYETTYGEGNYSQMTSGAIYSQEVATNTLNGWTSSYIAMPTEYAGFYFPDMGFGPNDGGYAAAFQATGNPAANSGFSGTAFNIATNARYSYTPGFVTSDRRTKANIEDVADDFEDKFLNQIKIYQFDKINYADDDDLHAYGKHVGVMADELKEIFPQWETSINLKDPDGADSDVLRAVNYEAMIPALIWICQRLNTRIKELEDRLGV
jgi:hypothetical protein